MELLDGRSLHSELRALGRLPVRRACFIGGQIARALAASHVHGIVHRDLKPENVFLVGDDFVKVLDFGIAKLLKHATQETDGGVMLGTARYMSPEQCRSAKGIDHRADIYALGMILYLMIAGRLPFVADTPGELVVKHLNEAPRPITDHVPDVPPRLARVIARAIEKDPAARFWRMDDLGDALAPFGGPARAPGEEPLPVRENPAPLDDDDYDDTAHDGEAWDPAAAPAPATLLDDTTGHAKAPRPAPWRAGAIAVAVTALGFLAGVGIARLRRTAAARGGANLPAANSQPTRANLQQPVEEVRLRIDSQPLQLRLDAPGFEPLVATLVPDGDRALALSLKPRRPRPAPRRPRPSGDELPAPDEE
jgi:serine/threonine-protein kinase